MIRAVIFDLDGVIVSTDELHYQAWKSIANNEGLRFDREFNERFRGVSRTDCLELLLNERGRVYSPDKKHEICEAKNNLYLQLIKNLTPNDILPGGNAVLNLLRQNKVLMAIGSSSKNTAAILRQIGLDNFFDTVSDGNNITNSKPDPEVFIKAADMLGVACSECLVVEDADAGVEAALAAGMTALGIGSAASNNRTHYRAESLNDSHVQGLFMRLISLKEV